MSLLKKVFSGKSKITAQFSVTIHRVSELPSDKTNNASGGHIFVEWKKGRGEKNRGETRRILCNHKNIDIDETFSFSTKLLRDPKTEEFEKKPIEFHLRYAHTAEHKAKLLGEITLNLAEYCHKPLFNISTEYVLTDKKKMTDIKLHMSISAHWVKVDGKKYSNGEAVAQGDVADDDDTESEITHMSEHSHPSDSESDAVDFDEEDHKFEASNTDYSKKMRRPSDPKKSRKPMESPAKSKKRFSDRLANGTRHARVRSGDQTHLVEQARLGGEPLSPRSVSERHIDQPKTPTKESLTIPRLEIGNIASFRPIAALDPAPIVEQVPKPLVPPQVPLPANSPFAATVTQEEIKLRAEMDLIATECKSLRKELAISRNKVKVLEDEKTRCLLQIQQIQQQQSTVAGSCESSDSSSEAKDLQGKLSQATTKLNQLTIENQSLRKQLSSLPAGSRSTGPRVWKPLLTPQEEKVFYMIVLLILMILSIFAQLQRGWSAASTSDAGAVEVAGEVFVSTLSDDVAMEPPAQ